MGLLSFIFKLPLKVLAWIWWIVVKLLQLLGVLLTPIVGKIRWQAPGWLVPFKKAIRATTHWCWRHIGILSAVVVGLALLGSAAFYGYNWYLNRPQPIEAAPIVYKTYSVRLSAPSVTNYQNTPPTISKLRLYFGGPVAPLDKIGKSVEHGVTLSPALSGEWKWESEKYLVFTPHKDWPVGQEFKVALDEAQLVAEQSRLERHELSFTTAAFAYSFSQAEFYQDPQQPQQKSAIFHVRFSHPVDPVSFEKQLSMWLEPVKPEKVLRSEQQTYGFSVKYNDKKLDAWIRSEPVSLPARRSKMVLTIDSGVRTINGEAVIKQTGRDDVVVPTVYSLNINQVAVSLAETEQGRQQQVLVMSASDAIKDSELKQTVKVWLLPKDYQDKENDQVFNNYHWSVDSVTEDLLTGNALLPLTLNDAEFHYQTTHSFAFSAPPSRYLLIEIKDRLLSQGGYRLSAPYYQVLRVPDYPQKLHFMSEGAILSLKGERKVSVVTRNVNGLALNIKRVIPSQLQHLVAFNSNRFENMRFRYISNEHFTESFSYTQAVNNQFPGEMNYHGIDLSNYLEKSPQGERGVFLVSLRHWAPEYASDDEKDDEEYDEDVVDSKLIIVTDLGIIAKRSQDGSSDVFVQSIRSGLPVAGATVSVLGKNGVTLLSEKTDQDGHARFASLAGYNKEKTPVLYLVEKAGDISFLPAPRYNRDRSLDLSRFDTYGVENPSDPNELTAHLFSDRGVYRPGETFHIGMIVKTADWVASLDGVPLQAEIYDPRGELVESSTIILNKTGFDELTYMTSETSPTGAWRIYLYLSDTSDQEWRTPIGSTVVQVKEFEADTMKVALTLTPEVRQGWVSPAELQASIKVENLFGTPAQDRVVRTTMTLRPMSPYFKNYEDYLFFDGYRSQERFNIELEEQHTDAEGEAELPLLLEEYQGASYQLELVAEAFEAGSGRSVAAIAYTYVSPNEYLIGAKSDGSLDYIQRNAKRILEFVAIDNAVQPTTAEGLTLRLIERKYLSVLTLQNSGVYKYQSKLKEQVIAEHDWVIDASGSQFTLPTEQPGDFVLLVENQAGQVVYRTSFSVVGQANISRSLDRNAELSVKLAKAEYQPGEEIEVAINAPYTGSGLITIERDRVYSWHWFTSQTTSSVQKIRLPEELEGNAYINVQFVRDPHSDEIFMSPLSYAVMPFSISKAKRQAAVTLKAPEVVKPGAVLPITVEVSGKQRVVVFAIDEGILQVARYRLSNPLDTFFKKRELAVDSAQILDLILPEFSKVMSLTAAAGGDGSEELDKHLNPFKRKRDEPVVFWSGLLDIQDSTTLEYTVPDYFNGKLRVMAVAVAADKIGTAQAYTTVRDDFVLTPHVPIMVAPGDEFVVSVGVANNLTDLPAPIPVKISLATSKHLELIDSEPQQLTLAEKREGVVRFKLRALTHLGSADLQFTAQYQDQQTQRMSYTSVRPLTTYRTQTVMGRMPANSLKIGPLRQMFDIYAQREARVSYSPLVLSRGLADYLANYAYYCSEQLVSRAVPALILRNHPELLPNSPMKQGGDPLEQLMNTLRSRQNSRGAIGMWRTTPVGDTFATLYTVHYLLETKEHNLPISTELLQNANRFLRDFAGSQQATDLYTLRLQSYAVYLLTRQGEVTTNLLATVQERLQRNYNDTWQSDLAAVYLASAYQQLKMDKAASQLLEKPWKALTKAYQKAWWTQNYYDPLVENASLLYLVARHFPEKIVQVPEQVLENMVLALNEDRYTTLSSAMTILALDAYFTQLAGDQGETLLIQAAAPGTGEQVDKPVWRGISQLQGMVARGRFTGQDQQLQIDNQRNLPAWYQVTQMGYDLAPPTEPIKQGLEIYREYLNAEGKPVTDVVLGEKLNVRIKLRSVSEEWFDNVVIVDLLPGGFEVVQQTPSASDDGEANWVSPLAVGGSWRPDYSDVREDRVIIYGRATRSLQEFTYQIKATNVGSFQIPPAYGEVMYDRRIQAVAAMDQRLTVTVERGTDKPAVTQQP